MNNYNRNKTQQNFNNNNNRGFSRNNNMGNFPRNSNGMPGLLTNNNLFMDQTLHSNSWGHSDYSGNMNYYGQLNQQTHISPLLYRLFSNLSVSSNFGGSIGQGALTQRNYQQNDASSRQALGGARSSGTSSGATNKKHRDVVPPPGQPGGPGDPLRAGLNSAGIRWYIRYLKEGYAPQEARHKAGNQRQPEKAQSQSEEKVTSQEQPKSKGNTKKSPDSKKTKASVLEKRLADIRRSAQFPMVVMPVDYPSKVLDQDELIKLENAIVDEIAKGWEIEPEFSGTNFDAGCLHIACINEATSKWLEERVPQLANWQGLQLKACAKDALPKANTITITFPRSGGQEVDKTLALVAAQNKDINTSSWKILSHKDEHKSQVLTIAINEESVEALKKKEHILNYRFGRVILQSVREQAKEVEVKVEEKETTEEEKKVESKGAVGVGAKKKGKGKTNQKTASKADAKIKSDDSQSAKEVKQQNTPESKGDEATDENKSTQEGDSQKEKQEPKGQQKLNATGTDNGVEHEDA